MCAAPLQGDVTWDCNLADQQVQEDSVTFHVTHVRDEVSPGHHECTTMVKI